MTKKAWLLLSLLLTTPSQGLQGPDEEKIIVISQNLQLHASETDSGEHSQVPDLPFSP
jgi:hypothetical protein